MSLTCQEYTAWWQSVMLPPLPIEIPFMTLERRQLTAEEFARLPEYSCSQPTGGTPGKVWKRNLVAYTPHSNRGPRWVICEYVICSDNDQYCYVAFSLPEIVN